jgi:FAD/FMN-containing dehydrogenase
MLPVSPGTRYVTVAGAIANDVHGKNHHGFGTFGRHILSLELLRSNGDCLVCSRLENPELFTATIGGLGLTGLILRATLQLRRVVGLSLEVEHVRFRNLDEFMGLANESDERWEYTAAWIDCLASGRYLGRGVFSRARSVPGGPNALPPSRPAWSFAVELPVSLATTASVKVFNALYWRKLGVRGRVKAIQSFASVIYPLDAIDRWNRAYGPRGFFQFQCVLPPGSARVGTTELLEQISFSRQGSILTVLKLFGDLESPGLLSFPKPGLTLAVDFPNRGEDTRQLLSRLEHIVIAAGGRIYPAKDSHMSAESYRLSYPNMGTFMRYIDPRFSSAFSRRVGLVAPVSTKRAA